MVWAVAFGLAAAFMALAAFIQGFNLWALLALGETTRGERPARYWAQVAFKAVNCGLSLIVAAFLGYWAFH